MDGTGIFAEFSSPKYVSMPHFSSFLMKFSVVHSKLSIVIFNIISPFYAMLYVFFAHINCSIDQKAICIRVGSCFALIKFISAVYRPIRISMHWIPTNTSISICYIDGGISIDIVTTKQLTHFQECVFLNLFLPHSLSIGTLSSRISVFLLFICFISK